ncbi:MAG TPA: hypothetical protein VK150_05235, partial [Geothrix sp.]|nr:hypothetical protein [Geothrix sp.]
RRYDHRNRTHIKEWWRSEFRQPRTGILIGFRTLANGTIDLGDYDKPTTFKATEHFKAALVVFNAKTKPVFVHLDDLTNEIIMPQVKA